MNELSGLPEIIKVRQHRVYYILLSFRFDEKNEMRDLLVVLPGITGSALEKNGTPVWGTSGKAVWNFARSLGASVRSLELATDDPQRDDLGDGVVATRLMPDTVIVPGFKKIDGYGRLTRFLKESFPVEEGANYFEFPYDWRRDNRVAARKLERLIGEALPQWRERSGNRRAKAILIAHSMGGLISRYYLEVLEGWRNVKALVSFGTPYRGSIKSFNYIANGYRIGTDISAMMRSLTSVYQLLPQYRCVEAGGEWIYPQECEGLPEFDGERARQAAEFHQEIARQVEAHRALPGYEKLNVIPVVGSDQETLQSAKFEANRLVASRGRPPKLDEVLAHGDGTVPAASAIPLELSQKPDIPWIPEQHASLQNAGPALAFLGSFLRMTQVETLDQLKAPAVPGIPAQRPALSLSVEDVYLAGEPVEIRAGCERTGRIDSVEAAIFAVDGSRPPVRTRLAPNGESWRTELPPMAAGTYRVIVDCTGEGPLPPPVHDVFAVFDMAAE